jgi:FMN-dependent NADH-azoreductase
MSTLLHVSASPRDASSDSRALAGAFLDTYRRAHPDVVVEELDLFDGKLPAFGGLAAGAKMAVWGGGQPSAEQQGEWAAARAVFDRFAAADAYLFSAPMWNAGVPYVLKQWVDIVSQPGWLFSFTPDVGYCGLIRGKKAAVIYVLQRLAALRRLHRRRRDPLAAHRAHRRPRRRQGRRPAARRRDRPPILTAGSQQ